MSNAYAQSYTYDVVQRINCDHEERFDLAPDDNGVQPLLTGMALIMNIRHGAGIVTLTSTPAAGLQIAADGKSFTVTLTRALAETIGIGVHSHELLVERADGKRFLQWTGNWTIEAAI
jgi:hypothetical protein